MAFIAFLGLSLISCNNDTYEPIPVKMGDENGTFKTRLIVTQGKGRTEKIMDFTVKDSVITYKEFAIKEIVKSVLTDAAKADSAVAAMGKIEYKLNFTPKLMPQQNVIEFTFAPKTLTLQIPADGAVKTTVVTFTAAEKGYFIGQDWSLRFGFVADKITVDGVELTSFEKINYNFPYSLKY